MKEKGLSLNCYQSLKVIDNYDYIVPSMNSGDFQKVVERSCDSNLVRVQR